MSSITTVAFIGLGVMGYPMAGHLAKQGLTTRVYNRTAAKAQAWADQFGGTAHATPAEAAQGADLVLMCVGNDDDVRQVTTGEHGVLQSMAPGSYLVDHTTASADLALELDAACRQKSLHFIDAPVSGGQQGAENGALTIMCGGEQAHFDAAAPVLDHYARAVTLMGPPAAASSPKWSTRSASPAWYKGWQRGCTLPNRQDWISIK